MVTVTTVTIAAIDCIETRFRQRQDVPVERIRIVYPVLPLGEMQH
jgi:hypothetical protein